jgi:hypothetical protein
MPLKTIVARPLHVSSVSSWTTRRNSPATPRLVEGASHARCERVDERAIPWVRFGVLAEGRPAPAARPHRAEVLEPHDRGVVTDLAEEQPRLLPLPEHLFETDVMRTVVSGSEATARPGRMYPTTRRRDSSGWCHLPSGTRRRSSSKKFSRKVTCRLPVTASASGRGNTARRVPSGCRSST